MMESNNRIPLEETLLPALMQCFGIIFLGYILGKIKVLRQNEARGLSIFVQYLSLPALIFSTVSTMSFTKMKWEFVAAVFVAKACVFICVALFSIILTHPLHLGKAGIYAIAATQSNDIALGYPLLVSLYQNAHPDYPAYLYIVAPMQLLLLNGIGFFFLELEKHNHSDSKWKNCHLLYIIKDIFKNPVIVVTLIGLVWNITYGQKVLPILDTILKAFSAAFPATALLLLGYTMNLSYKNSSHISVSVALIIISKNLLLPIILQKISTFMLQSSSSEEIKSFSTFGFLYGTIPIAPTVYVFATQYESGVNIIAKAILGSTLLSAPLMFSSASVISLVQIGVQNTEFYLSQTISYLSVINAVCCLWLLILFCIGKRWRNVSFSVTFYLVFAQFLTAIGGLMLFSSPKAQSVLFYVQYVLTSGSIYSTRMCSLLLAILLLIIRIRSLCYVLHMKKIINFISIIMCFILPYVISSCLILYKGECSKTPSYQLGYIQIVTTFTLTSITLIVTVLCLIFQRIYSKKIFANQNETYNQNSSLNNDNSIIPVYSNNTDIKVRNACCDIEDLGKSLIQVDCSINEPICSDIEDHICNHNYPCSTARRVECSVQVSKYISENQEIGTGINDNEHFLKHISLLIALCIAMTLSLSVCLWKLVLEDVNGIFIELEFLDAIINYSLGIFFFILFGFDKNLLHIIYTKWKFVWAKLLPCETNATEQQDISGQFISHHYEKCKEAITEVKFINNVEYRDIFSAEKFVQWISRENIVQTIDEADNYMKCLLMDHVIEKVYENNNFSKNLHFLRFTQVCHQ